MSSEVTSDPFGKIRKMIKDLIMRLTVVDNDETSRRGWCDAELSNNGLTRKQHLRRSTDEGKHIQNSDEKRNLRRQDYDRSSG